MIPTSVLAYLQPAGMDAAAALATGSANLAVETGASRPFTAPLAASGQAAIAGLTGIFGYSKNLVVQ
jgi:hypothetical protein